MFQRAKAAENELADEQGTARVTKRIHDLRGTCLSWLAQHRLTNEEIAGIVGSSARAVDELRPRHVDELRVVEHFAERLAQA